MGKSIKPSRPAFQKVRVALSELELSAARRRLGLTAAAQTAALEAAADLTLPAARALYDNPGQRWTVRPAQPGEPPRRDTGILSR